MQQILPSTLPDFSQATVLIVGDMMLDRYWFGATSRISPEAPVPVVHVQSKNERPGGAGNVALNIAALGTHATLLGITGTDEAATILKQQLQAANVTTDFIAQAQAETIIKLRVISKHQQLLRADFESRYPAATCFAALTAKFEQHLAQAQLVVLSDYQKGTLHDPAALIALARARNIPVLVDPKGTDFSIYRQATIVTPNLKEFEAVAGSCETEQALEEKARALMAQHAFQAMLITRGEQGMTLIQKNLPVVHLPAFAREVFDVTGAGDTVIAALAVAFASGLNLPEATAIANIAASIVVGKLGATTVTMPELQAEIEKKGKHARGIMNEEQLMQAVQAARAQGKKIVFTNGCFDIIHAGHVTSLQMAKELGDYLIVAVNTDESIKKIKGPNRPINHLEHRMTVLAGLEAVDWVIPFADATPERLLEKLRPDFLAKGGDYRLDEVVGADIVRAYGGDVRIMKHNITTSSTAILNQLNDE